MSDETVIDSLSHLLENNNLGKEIFEAVKTYLSAQGMTMRQGTVVDATLITVPSSIRNQEGKSDLEIH